MTRALIISVLLLSAWPVRAQTSSIGKRAAAEAVGTSNEGTAAQEGNPTLEERSLIAVQPQEPRKYKVNDLITIIVRVQSEFESDGTTNNSRRVDLDSQLDAFLKWIDGGVGASTFSRGKPNIEYSGTFNQRLDAESERDNSFITRVTGRVIDVKPNGNLIIEARSNVRHDEEEQIITLTGTCRSTDVTPDNTVLSTQVSNLNLNVKTKGNVRNATRPGWLGTLIDWIRPL
jgi:flagellar L-ring protein precursor FlgH